MTSAVGVGFGKVILLGEHAVVYGYPALAAALPQGVTLVAALQPGDRGAHGLRLTLELESWRLAVDTAALPEHPVSQALCAIAAELVKGWGGDAPSWSGGAVRLHGTAEIWPSAGLGSSAALAVAAARALGALAGRALDDAAVRAAASAGERVFHGQPSGLDVALATSGGAGVFERQGGLVPLPLPRLGLVIGHSGAPRSTAAMVARVAERTAGDRDDARLRELGQATARGLSAVAARDLPALGAAMDAAHGQLAALGVSTDRLDEMCALARGAGALGAKLTGAGGGGCAIALVPPGASALAAAIEAAWQLRGLDTRRVELGAG